MNELAKHPSDYSYWLQDPIQRIRSAQQYAILFFSHAAAEVKAVTGGASDE